MKRKKTNLGGVVQRSHAAVVPTGRRTSHVGDFACFFIPIGFAPFVGASGAAPSKAAAAVTTIADSTSAVAAASAEISMNAAAIRAASAAVMARGMFFRAGADGARRRRRRCRGRLLRFRRRGRKESELFGGLVRRAIGREPSLVLGFGGGVGEQRDHVRAARNHGGVVQAYPPVGALATTVCFSKK